MVARNRLDFTYRPLDVDYREPEIRTFVGDARNLNLVPDCSVDLVATHPPYAGIISYSGVEGDLSGVRGVSEFVVEMGRVARECMRVLRPGGHCAILMGDTRRGRHFVPIAVRVLMGFLDAGFILREDIVKLQWKTKSTRERWRGRYDFLLIAHEHLYIFRKAEQDEKTSRLKDSMRWW